MIIFTPNKVWHRPHSYRNILVQNGASQGSKCPIIRNASVLLQFVPMEAIINFVSTLRENANAMFMHNFSIGLMNNNH
ncbi:hypothetical protein QR98_0027340 [Sarcoptes scabiei]|uniref:Uncharacterized protein n=1 Tax=Sarcoptes scabiei TaxID=52283 RepID=A0A132A077_SARSC|nr:hypothetical protein QR98_0027340 [Sarcoptes scabiei]